MSQHRKNAFFYDSIEKLYLDVFKPSDTKDENLLNIIDYFTEPPQSKAVINNFIIKNANIEYTCRRGDQIKFSRLNTQLINELLQVILLINNQEKKYLLLAQHIFLNFNYVYFKAKQGNLIILVNLHKMIDDLNKKTQGSLTYLSDLFKISSIFKEHYFKIQNLPKSLAYYILNSLRNNLANMTISGFLSKFEIDSIATNGLITPYSTVTTSNNSIEDLFTTSAESKITSLYYSGADCPLMILITNNSELNLINYQSLKLIGSVKLQFEASNNFIAPIFTRKPNFSVQRLNYIQGLVIYESGNNIYKLNFSDLKQTILKSYQNPLRNLYALSVNTILVHCDTFIEIIDLDKNEVTFHKDVKSGIKSLSVNKQKQPITSADFDVVDRVIVLIIDRLNNLEICNFIKAKQTLNTLFELESDEASLIDDCFLDELFYVENIFLYNYNQLFSMFEFNNLDVYLRVAILSKTTNSIKLFTLFNDTQYEIVSYELQIDILNIVKYFNNKIIFNSNDDFLYIYDFGE